MPEPKPVQPVVGHFHLTVVVVFEPGRDRQTRSAPAARRLRAARRGGNREVPLNRLMKSQANALAVCGGEYRLPGLSGSLNLIQPRALRSDGDACCCGLQCFLRS